MQKRKYWGWGYDSHTIATDALEVSLYALGQMLGRQSFEKKPIPQYTDLPKPKFTIPQYLQTFVSSSNEERASHSYGKAFRDIWRAVYEGFPNPPDYVAFPENEEHIIKLYDFASTHNINLIPYGGGSSVVGGIEPCSSKGNITVDMKHFDKLIHLNLENRTVEVQAGIYGPALNALLKPNGLTLRHFPQSFEFSTLGGWIVTRAGGHFATVYTYIDDFVQQVTMISPKGKMVSNYIPESGAGPSLKRIVAGSEGIMGIVTSAVIKVQKIPQFKSSATISFDTFEAGVEACRSLSQSGLSPANARLISATEAFINGAGDGTQNILIIGFESSEYPVDIQQEQAETIAKSFGGKVLIKKGGSTEGTWKDSFLEAPYLRDELVRRGIIVETFETCTTWSNFNNFNEQIITTAKKAFKKHGCKGMISVRFTHLYQDGPAPYYTIFAIPEEDYTQLSIWDQIKTEVSNKLVELGGAITHHHAVGKDHQPFYEDQTPELFTETLRQIKHTLDPKWIMNDGVLIKRK